MDRKDKIKKKIATIPKLYRPVYKRAVSGKSLRAAINAQCLDCVAYVRTEITQCTALDCPLYLVRPYQDKSSAAHRQGVGTVE